MNESEDMTACELCRTVEEETPVGEKTGPDMAERFPEVDERELENNPAFRRFCGSRFGVENTAELYEDYLAFADAAMRAADSRAADRRRRSTGGGSGRSGNGLSAEQQRALDEWNRAYPAMRMSAKEFLSR